MRDQWKGFVETPDEEQREDMWSTAFIAVDANILLGLYRFSKPTREEFLQVFRALRSKLWLPYWVGEEFYRNRPAVIDALHAPYEASKAVLREAERVLRTGFKSIARSEHPYVEGEKTRDVALSGISRARKQLDAARGRFSTSTTDDRLLRRIEYVFRGRVGGRPDDAARDVQARQAMWRIRRGVPPGYADLETKPIWLAVGDALVWMELLEEAKNRKQAFIFVTDDRKDDWWVTSGNERTPRPELRREAQETAGVDCWMYESRDFLSAAQEHLGRQDEKAKKALEEVDRVERREQDPFVGLRALESALLASDQWAADLQRAQNALARVLEVPKVSEATLAQLLQAEARALESFQAPELFRFLAAGMPPREVDNEGESDANAAEGDGDPTGQGQDDM